MLRHQNRKQIEPRFLSHISGDANFMGAYIDGRDLYSEIASSTFKKPIEECGDGSVWRKQAKVVLLGNMYGISAKSLSEQFGITLQEAEQIYIDFLEAYPTMAQWFKEVQAHADEHGFVQMLFGRKRRFIGHDKIARRYHQLDTQIKKIVGRDTYDLREDKDLIPYKLRSEMYAIRGDFNRVQRQSVNAMIQGSSAMIMKKAMIDVYKHVEPKGWKIIATIHDEILIEVPDTITPEEVMEIERIQREAVKLNVPMKCDVEVSKVWGKGVSFAEWVDAGCGTKVFEK